MFVHLSSPDPGSTLWTIAVTSSLVLLVNSPHTITRIDRLLYVILLFGFYVYVYCNRNETIK